MLRSLFLAALTGSLAAAALPVEKISEHLSVVRGAVNGVLLEDHGAVLAVYGDPGPDPVKAEQVLFTHHRRDVAWAGRALVARGAQAVVPAAEKDLFSNPGDFWSRYRSARVHDYSNQSSRILAEPIPVAKTVADGDVIRWRGIVIRVLGTPGYTRGAVSYLIEADGKRIACPGDLIYGDGKFLDLYSLQDAIPQYQEDGYHGYGARAGDVIVSLRKIADWKPDLMIPARGPVIRDPKAAVDGLVRRFQAVFASHFEIDALRWYRGDEKLRGMASRIMGSTPVDWMPTAETAKLPQWIIPITNSRLIVSQSGAAFLIDCGNNRVVEEVRRLKKQGTIKQLDGIYITHYHDDHTDMAQATAAEYHCPVYFTREMRDILEHPEAYRMPCLTPNAIHSGRPMETGTTQHWNEFEFTYSYFPGQTLFHGGLAVHKQGSPTIFFAGDSFTPTGMDDYCLLNRNFVAPEPGFLECLRTIKHLTGDYLLVNQHVEPAFHYSSQQLDRMTGNFEKRRGAMANLFPWDDPNFGLDEQSARFYPYTAETASGGQVELTVILRNHSPEPQEFRVTPHAPSGLEIKPGTLRVTVPGRQERSVRIPVTVKSPGLKIVTADVAFGPWDLREWTEAMVTGK